MIQTLGWVATSVFVASYFCSTSRTLRNLQMAASVLWTVYGVAIHAIPVIAANILVFAAAAWTSMRTREEATVDAATLRAAPAVEARSALDGATVMLVDLRPDRVSSPYIGETAP